MSPDPALHPPLVHLNPGPEYSGAARSFQGIPGIERAPTGRLWATWYGGGPGEGPENYVVLVTSGDDGRSWSSERLVIDPPGEVRAFDPCLWLDPGGRLWLFWAQGHSWWDGRAGVWAILTDHPDEATPRWSAPRRLCNGIMMNKPVVLSTGAWALPAAVWNVPPSRVAEERYRYSLPEERGANLIVSRDGGDTWARIGGARVPDSTFDEHMVVERRDGSLRMLVRTKYGIGESESRDGGRSWTAGRPSGISHVNARFFIRRLASGRLLLVTHNPPAGDTGRSHLTAHLSEDDGLTWKAGLLLDHRNGVSYPDGVQAADGTVYVIYDYSRTGEKQILMTTFSEDDIRRGAFASPVARERVLVHQASGKKQTKG